MNFRNVKEKWYMYDTIVVSPFLTTLAHPIPGWFENFADLSQADDLTFFNSRNRSIGLAYCNQETKDQLPYALEAETISVGFFAPSTASQIGYQSEESYKGRVDFVSTYWENELPQHTSAIFRVNQDERLKTNVGMLPSGYGPVGNSIGQGDTSLSGGSCTSVSTSGFGRSHFKYRWEFPTKIGIPRRATMSVTIRFTEWVRQNLAKLWGPGFFEAYTYIDETREEAFMPSFFMIQCMISGTRQVQQRAEYHA